MKVTDTYLLTGIVIILVLGGILLWFEKTGKLKKTENTGKFKSILITIGATLAAVLFYVIRARAKEEAIEKRKEDVGKIDAEAKTATDEMKNAEDKINDAKVKAKDNVSDEKKRDDNKSNTEISNDVDNLLDS